MTIDIYLITCIPTNEVYVGKSVNYLDRFRAHISQSKNDKKCVKSISKKIRVYGEKNFKVELLEQCLDHEQDERELFWIDHYIGVYQNKCLNIIDSTGSHRRPILEITTNTLYSSFSDAADKTGIDKSDIRFSCREKIGKAKLGKNLSSRLKGLSFKFTFLTDKDLKPVKKRIKKCIQM